MLVSKFLHSDHLDNLSSGTFLFRRFDKFHDLVPPIGDRLEGRTAICVNNYVYHPSHGQNPLGPGIDFGACTEGGGFYDGFSLVYEVPICWIACFSIGSAEIRAGDMLLKEGGNYDAAADILNIERVVELIWKSGRDHAGRIIRSEFEDLKYGPVQYTSVSQITNETGAKYLAPHPFQKDTNFESQKEYRLALYPKADDGKNIPEELFIKCPRSKALIRPAIRDGVSITKRLPLRHK